MNGILLVNKEFGKTSFDEIRRLKKILHEKHIGHTGTLDPIATGVLVITIGDGCKLSQFLEADSKIYECEITIGIATDSYDTTGNIINKQEISELDVKKVDEVLKKFIGEYMQYPPIYSAIKKDGKKLYEYARSGKEVEITPRKITIFSLNRTSDIIIKDGIATFKFITHVSKGTYIRSLCKDIGDALNLPATMSQLLRKKAGIFNLEQCCTLDDIENNNYHIISLKEATENIPTLSSEEIQKLVKNGQKINENLVLNELNDLPSQIRIINNDNLMGIYEYSSQEKLYRAKRIWN